MDFSRIGEALMALAGGLVLLGVVFGMVGTLVVLAIL